MGSTKSPWLDPKHTPQVSPQLPGNILVLVAVMIVQTTAVTVICHGDIFQENSTVQSHLVQLSLTNLTYLNKIFLQNEFLKHHLIGTMLKLKRFS